MKKLVLLSLFLAACSKAPVETPTWVGSEPVPQASTAPVFAAKKSIKHITVKGSNVIYLLGEVGSNISGLISKLDTLNADSNVSSIYLLIDSPGGSVVDGAKLVSAMEASKKPVYTVCMTMCASMAAIIHQYGVKRYMVDRSLLMFHDAAGALQGPIPQMRSRLDFFDRLTTKMDAYIAKRAGIDLASFLQACHTELWVDAEDSTNKKLNDAIVYVTVEGAVDSPLNVFSATQSRKDITLTN